MVGKTNAKPPPPFKNFRRSNSGFTKTSKDVLDRWSQRRVVLLRCN
jgi:hypothetical protein